MINLNYNCKDNFVQCDDSVNLEGIIEGKDNKIVIGKLMVNSLIKIDIHGNNNIIFIDNSEYRIKKLKICVGNFNHANNVKLLIGKNFQCSAASLLLYNPKTQLLIGDNCMFSNSIIVRVGELPHLIFDKNTKQYIDITNGVYIGNSVWVGEGVYVTKKASIPDGCVVAAKSVVTRRFSTPNCVLAGNPAREAKSAIEWVKNRSACDQDHSSIFECYYNHSMEYTSEPLDTLDDFIENQRQSLKQGLSHHK